LLLVGVDAEGIAFLYIKQMGKTFEYGSGDGASSSVPMLVSLSRSSYDDLLDDDDDDEDGSDDEYNITNVSSKEAVAASPSSYPPSSPNKIDDGSIEIDDSYAEFLSLLGMSAYDIVQHNSGIKSIVQHPIYLPNDSYEDFLTFFGIIDPIVNPSGYEIQEKSIFRFAITSDKSFDSVSLDYMSAMCDMDEWSTGSNGGVVVASPHGSSIELSCEERMAILKEVETHLELLKEFVGVVPDDELADRKKALYAVLPTIPPGASDPKKKQSRLAIATTASATSVGEGQLVQYVLIVLVVRYLVWGDNK